MGSTSNGPARDFVITGAGKSELEDLVKPIGRRRGSHGSASRPTRSVAAITDPTISAFAKLGVPMLDGGSGEDLVVGGVTAAGHAATRGLCRPSLSQAAGRVRSANWDWSGAVQDLDAVLHSSAASLADDHDARGPNWYPTAEFRGIRDRRVGRLRNEAAARRNGRITRRCGSVFPSHPELWQSTTWPPPVTKSSPSPVPSMPDGRGEKLCCWSSPTTRRRCAARAAWRRISHRSWSSRSATSGCATPRPIVMADGSVT